MVSQSHLGDFIFSENPKCSLFVHHCYKNPPKFSTSEFIIICNFGFVMFFYYTKSLKKLKRTFVFSTDHQRQSAAANKLGFSQTLFLSVTPPKFFHNIHTRQKAINPTSPRIYSSFLLQIRPHNLPLRSTSTKTTTPLRTNYQNFTLAKPVLI